MAKAVETLATSPITNTVPTSEGEANSEGDNAEIVFQWVISTPQVTTSNNLTDAKVVKSAP